jgi:5-methyltetrahydrofolate--homocysteine methyltransferase
MAFDFEELRESVIDGDVEGVATLTQQAIDAGVDPVEIITSGLNGGMAVVGARFKSGEMFVPEVLLCARAMAAGMDLVKPLILASDMPSAGSVLLGTVKGDLHDIGKNLVGMMLESGGFTVINAGIDVEPEAFVQGIRDHKPDVVGLSAMLTTTMLAMKATIDLIKQEGLRDEVKVIIGGAPVSQDFADEIGADGFSPDGGSAIALCKSLIN